MQGSLPLTEDAPAGVAAGVVEPEPLITGKTPYLTAGIVAVFVVMALLFILLGRWRVGARAQKAATTKDFFEPAGEGAEITFEESTLRVGSPPGEFVEHAHHHEASTEPPKKKGGSPFSGLFAKREKQPPPQFDAVGAFPKVEDAEFEVVETEPASRPAIDWDELEREERRRALAADEASMREERRRRDAEDEEHARRAEEEERRWREREAAQRHADDNDTRRLAPETPSSPAPHDEIVRTLSEIEEALHVQREAIQAETRSLLDSFARRLSDRLDSAIADSLSRRTIERVGDFDAQARQVDTAYLEEIARRIDEHRSEVSAALGALTRRIDAMAASPAETTKLRSELADLKRMLSSATPPTAPAAQLSDIVRNALPPGGYDLDAALPNNRRADCLIRLARPPGPIAVDARFPVEAFHALHDRSGTAAENEFRRVALRHIVDVAERLICPGFTADSALLFLPTETMVTEIHARFPDVVQDSYRARVWIVSPTTLMATLHTLGAILRDAPRKGPDGAENVARQALAEVDRLARRLGEFERERAAKPVSAREFSSANDESSWVDEEPAADDGDLLRPATFAEEEREFESGEAAPHRPRPPFPLR